MNKKLLSPQKLMRPALNEYFSIPAKRRLRGIITALGTTPRKIGRPTNPTKRGEVLMKKTVLLMLLSLLLAVFFRIPLWTDLPLSVKKNNLKKAEAIVLKNLTEQMKATTALPDSLSDTEKNRIMDQKSRELSSSDREKFATTVTQLQKQLDDGLRSRYSKEYLQEADSYYYLSLTKNILEKGVLGPYYKSGTFFNPLRYALEGTWDRITWHPYVGAALYRLLQRFDKNISLARAAAYVPVALTVLMTAGIFFLLSALGVSPFLTWLGATVFLLLPAVILRSNYGWYDTDPYILFFSSAILGSLFWALRAPRKAIACGLGGGALTCLFALFWEGWLYIIPLIGIASLALILFEFLKRNRSWVPPLSYLAAYIAVPLVAAVFLLSPQALWLNLSDSFGFLSKAGETGGDFWPNLRRLVSETNAPSAASWFFLLGPETLLFGVLGLFAAGSSFLKEKNALRIRQWLVATILFIPLLVLSAQAQRYVMLVAPPLVLLAVLGMEWVIHLLRDQLLPGLGKISRAFPAFLVLTLAILPIAFLNAAKANEKIPGVMDEAWSKAMNYLRTETPRDAVVFSAWDPGYFINGIAERRNVVDGGTQNCPKNFWIAQALMSHDERLVAGIFRMVAGGGDQAFDYLKKIGMETDDAVALLMKILPLDRKEASNALPPDWTEPGKNDLLAFTHNEQTTSPVYLLVYSDMIKHNRVLQMSAGWNFSKAKKLFRPQEHGSWPKFGRAKDAEYFSRVTQLVGAPIPSQNPEPALSVEKNFLVYKDLLIDRVNKNAFMPKNVAAGTEMRPISLVYREGGTWIRKPVSDSPSAVWAVAFDMNDPKGGLKAMLARKELLDSVLFQLYYFGGGNYRSITPVTSQGSLDDANYVRIFRVDFSMLEQKKESGLPEG